MRKSILLALLFAVAMVAVACGPGNNAAKGNGAVGNTAGGGGDNAAAEDAMAFYKKVGNFSLTKTSMKMKMGDKWEDQPPSFTRMEVTKVDGGKITYKMTTYDKDMKETYSAEQNMDLTPKDAPATNAPAAPKPVEEEITVKAGKYKCLKSESDAAGTKSTSWSHKGMGVKTESKGATMEMTTELQEGKCE